MTSDELKTHLHTLNWRQAELARRVGVAPNTVYRWTAGLLPVPLWLVGYLDMAITVQRCVTRQAAVIEHGVPLAVYELADRIGIGYLTLFKERQRDYETTSRHKERLQLNREWGLDDEDWVG